MDKNNKSSEAYSLLSANYMDNTLETSFIDVNKLVSRSSVDFTNIGIDALERLIKSATTFSPTKKVWKTILPFQ